MLTSGAQINGVAREVVSDETKTSLMALAENWESLADWAEHPRS